ncbi:TetR/AcrR family transcriptional regulator [Endozoicomonas euniceicola]|uniref:TetR family transcriptional regulator n=1 Tax=Endozoicomonas euniceicola TaxID=1234143 RepID=A0ABY6GTD0_9GAMM|nr:TetR/AcrR family transcriptional regulator [Endozoicomonas euniceicola]UYM16028.1 TetR family transcriptional regulator [Endozoicomonas euniceicola]
MGQGDTVTKILDAAEALFAEYGFAETSLRSITSRAEVNLAAVNYHFGSKKALIQAVFARYLDPFAANLQDSLDALDDDEPPELEVVLNLLVDQIIEVQPRHDHGLSTFMKLLGLAYSQNQGHLKHYLTEAYGNAFHRYYLLLKSACPTLPPADMFWRTYFILGSAVFTMSGVETLQAIAKRDYAIEDSMVMILRRMVPFMAAGLRAHT